MNSTKNYPTGNLCQEELFITCDSIPRSASGIYKM